MPPFQENNEYLVREGLSKLSQHIAPEMIFSIPQLAMLLDLPPLQIRKAFGFSRALPDDRPVITGQALLNALNYDQTDIDIPSLQRIAHRAYIARDLPARLEVINAAQERFDEASSVEAFSTDALRAIAASVDPDRGYTAVEVAKILGLPVPNIRYALNAQILDCRLASAPRPGRGRPTLLEIPGTALLEALDPRTSRLSQQMLGRIAAHGALKCEQK